jgi:hypothetical protein
MPATICRSESELNKQMPFLMRKTRITVTITDNQTKQETTHVLLERELFSELYSDYDGVMDAVSEDVLDRFRTAILRAALREKKQL